MFKKIFVLLIILFAAGCSGIKSNVDTTKFKNVRYEGQKVRMAVPIVLCKAAKCNENIASITQDLLINELLHTNRFIMLERGYGLEEIKKELLLSQSDMIDVKKAIPTGLLEGADILVIGVITAVEPKKTKFFVPALIPWKEGGRHHITGGIAQYKESYIQIIVRLVDVRTGRVLKSIKGEGKWNWWNLVLGEGAFKKGGVIGGISVDQSIPMEQTIQNMVKKIAAEIIKSIPQEYYRHNIN